MSSSIAREVIRSLLGPAPMALVPGERLSTREEEVLRALASGHRYKEIAADLGLSPHTVRTHVHRIYQKLHVQNKAEATEFFHSRSIGGR